MDSKANQINDYFQTIHSVDEVIHAMLCGISEKRAVVDDMSEIKAYNSKYSELKSECSSVDEFIQYSNTWLMPDRYTDLDIETHCLKLCKTKEETDRVLMELDLYRERMLYPLLRYFVYLVDIMRKHNIIWGVGRGSSVSSYTLYLIGVHKVDSLKYNLDIREFLK